MKIKLNMKRYREAEQDLRNRIKNLQAIENPSDEEIEMLKTYRDILSLVLRMIRSIRK